jgi:ribA/ribD-fused uncharacterized protein
MSVSLEGLLSTYKGSAEALFVNDFPQLKKGQGRWTMTHAPVKKAQEREYYEEIARELTRTGVANVPEALKIVKRVNEVWTAARVSLSKIPLPSGPRIEFNSKDKNYGWMSNFFPTLIVFPGDSTVYFSAEQAYQMRKGEVSGQDVSSLGSELDSLKLKKLGKQAPETPERVKLDLMTKVVDCKFSENPVLLEGLIRTGSCKLVECTDSPFWGAGKDGTGANYLGHVIEGYRDTVLLFRQPLDFGA